MIIKLNGETTLDKLPQIIRDIVKDIEGRAGLDSTDIKIKDTQLGILFSVDNESKYITVDHDGLPEIFQVQVQLDEQGNVVKSVDNEKETFLDDYSRSVAMGTEAPCQVEIESVYQEKDIRIFDTFDYGDLTEKHYVHLSGAKIIRYYRGSILVGEVGMDNKKEAV